MSSRKEKIYDTIKALTEKSIKATKNISGVETQVIAEKSSFDRSNVSRELNVLLKEGRVIKIKGKPTLYLEKSVVLEKFKKSYLPEAFDNLEELMNCANSNTDNPPAKNTASNLSIKNSQFSSDSFKSLIGFNGSLTQQIEQAKSGVLYPPHGLHMLILGETGVGKSTFVESIHKFLINTDKNRSSAPLVTLNCADYSYNFQLIYSQLFGYLRGAFTGADKDKDGLIEKAQNGILFLDEVHRLPSEAQEMLFQLIDKGQYRRLGDTKLIQNNKVLIICATTEDPESSMLQSFLRRIPIVINIPSLSSRPTYEKIEIMNYFLNKECTRLNETMEVTRHVFLCLLSHEFKSNIGELYSTIQIICAKAYLDKIMHNKRTIEVDVSHLPKMLLENYSKHRFLIEEKISHYPFQVKEIVYYNPKEISPHNITYTSEDKYNYDYYNLIQDKYHEFVTQNYSKTDIWTCLEQTIEDYFQNFFYKLKSSSELDENLILKFIDQLSYFKISNIIESLDEMHYIRKNTNLLYGFMLHIENLVNRIRQDRYIRQINTERIKIQYPEEFMIAEKIRKLIEVNFSIQVPIDEAAVLTLFIHSTKSLRNKDVINVIVICHGNSIATDMAAVTNTLLGVNHALALDMPLDMSVREMEIKVINLVTSIKTTKGIVFLVDMGSLAFLDKKITETLKIPARAIDMVSTPMLIEATRKSLLPEMTLEALEADLRSFSLTPRTLDNEFKYENNSFLRRVYSDVLVDTFTFLDPNKTIKLLLDSFKFVTEHYGLEPNEGLTIKYLFHTSAMLERVIKKESLGFYKDENEVLANIELLDTIKEGFRIIEQSFGIEVPESEFCYVIEIFSPYVERW
jgi:transcriptional regulator with AAA-type ATPase domain/transcriptional regulatory protein LevR